MDPGHWWGPGFGFMWIMPLLFFGVFLFFVWSMLGRRPGGGNDRPQSESAREILDKRLAKGEISAEEYAEMKRVLGNGR